jgi:hypothetical protein
MALCFAGCTKYAKVEFDGTATGLKTGVFIVKDLQGHAVYGETIKDGKFHVAPIGLETPGYYTMDIIDDANKTEGHPPFEIYLEDGKYTITANADKISSYPEIVSTSSIQNELSGFYTLADKLNGDITKQQNALNAKIKNKSTNNLSQEQLVNLLNQVSDLDAKKTKIMPQVLSAFIEKYPQNVTGPHILLKQQYEADPVMYYNFYKKFPAATQNSEEGKEIGEKLGRLVKLVPGAGAPILAGKLLDGSAFDPAAMHKKIFLVDFWRSANEMTRRNHVQIADMVKDFGAKGFGVVSVSMDTKPDWWKSAVKEDGMTWPQLSDLKGDDSPNTLNWSVTSLPRYDLVDGNWHIIERDIAFLSVYVTVQDYLNKH